MNSLQSFQDQKSRLEAQLNDTLQSQKLKDSFSQMPPLSHSLSQAWNKTKYILLSLKTGRQQVDEISNRIRKLENEKNTTDYRSKKAAMFEMIQVCNEFLNVFY